LKINAAGISLIKKYEGCVLHSYKCPAGVWTIAFGHTGPEVKEGQLITQHAADVILQHDLEKFEERVSDLTRKLALTENQFSALVSFAFNLGSTALANSTLMKRLLKGDTAGAAEQFEKWVNAGGKKLEGLVKRRAAERDLFLT
jgi:lysozyme